MRHFLASARRRRLVLNLVGLLLIAALITMQAFDGTPAIAAGAAGVSPPGG